MSEATLSVQSTPEVDLSCDVKIFANNFQALGFNLDATHKGKQGSGFEKLISAKNQLEIAAPPDHQYDTIKFIWKWDKEKQIFWQRDKFGRINMLSLREFLNAPCMDELLTDRSVVRSITYFDKIGGKKITEAEAIAANDEYDPANKPTRPGASNTATSSTSSTSGASSSTVTPEKTRTPLADVSGPSSKRKRD